MGNSALLKIMMHKTKNIASVNLTKNNIENKVLDNFYSNLTLLVYLSYLIILIFI